MQSPIPRSAHAYGDTSSRNCPTYPNCQLVISRLASRSMHTLKASPSPVKSISTPPSISHSFLRNFRSRFDCLTSSNYCQCSGRTTKSIFETHLGRCCCVVNAVAVVASPQKLQKSSCMFIKRHDWHTTQLLSGCRICPKAA